MTRTRNWHYAWERGKCSPRGNIYGEAQPNIFYPSPHAIREVSRVMPAAMAMGWTIPELANTEHAAGLNSLAMLVAEKERIGRVSPVGIDIYWPGKPGCQPLVFRPWNTSKWMTFRWVQKQLKVAA